LIPELSLLDTFMPEDQCARCDDAEPVIKFSLVVRRVLEDDSVEQAKLHFCSSECRQVFSRSIDILKQFDG